MELYLYWLMHLSGVFVSDTNPRAAKHVYSLVLSFQTLFAFNYGLLSYYTDPHEVVRVTMLI